ncbi:MAG: retropepsin-like aspartic protease [Erysipelotrichaceae bacterium]
MAKQQKVVIHRTIQKDFIAHESYEAIRRRFANLQQINLNANIERRVYAKRFQLKLTKHFAKVYSVKVKVNGKTLSMLVDTGAQISALFDDVSLDLKEEKQTLTIGSVSGQTQEQKFYRSHEMDLGGMILYNVGFTSLQRTKFKIMNIKVLRIDGILGWDILSQFDFSLDEQALVFHSDIETTIPNNMIHASFPTLLGNDASGSMVVLGFDSGAHYSWIDEGEILRMQLNMQEEGNAFTMGVHGLEKIPIKLVEKVKYYLAHNAILIHQVHTGYTRIFPNIKYNAILGNEILKGYRIYFINSKECIRLEERK